MEAITRRMLSKALKDPKVPIATKKRLLKTHASKPELAAIIRNMGIDKEDWYQKMAREADLKEAIKEELSAKRERQLRQTKGEIAHQMLYTQRHPFTGEKGDQQRRIIAQINKRLGASK